MVCDEGHILRNEASGVSKAMNAIKTRRRVVLTGTPLQNNLLECESAPQRPSEYFSIISPQFEFDLFFCFHCTIFIFILVWNQTLYIDTAHFVPTDHCMVNFIKKNLLGSLGEFRNRFINPIQNGQCADSTPRDVRIMKKRAHVLYAMLAGCVQVTMRYCRFQAVSARSVLVLYSCPYELVLSSFREEITLSWLSFCLPNMSMCWRWGYPLFSISCTAATWIRSLVRICPHIVAVRKVL